MKNKLPLDYLKTVLNYDPVAGAIAWKTRPSKKIRQGDVAGYVNYQKYCAVKINGKTYPTHRIIWAFEHGIWPKASLQHIDGNKLNNHISNLKEFVKIQHQKPTDRTGRLPGTTFHKKTGKWQAAITINGQQKYLGLFLTELEAHERCKNYRFISEQEI